MIFSEKEVKAVSITAFIFSFLKLYKNK